jgi:hypothetical protein
MRGIFHWEMPVRISPHPEQSAKRVVEGLVIILQRNWFTARR